MTERPAAARAAGFEAVEILFPYDEDAAALRQAIAGAGLPVALINCPPPNYASEGGPRGFAAVPGGEERFRHDFRRSCRYASALGAERVHVMAGVAEGPEAGDSFATNLAWAANEVPGLQLTVEPLNPDDMPGYFLDDLSLALAVIEEVGAPNLSLQFDAYHVHKLTGDVLGTWDAVREHVGHVQIADHPGRHEPGSGEIDYAAFLARLDTDGYEGWVSAEYRPRADTGEGLGWMAALSP
ncbi:hydroxypyruvate isomerase family protein [Histidinibacterium aquaticum]|nr:TIM barrel protein [Histidinibacterium aquaticum]